MDPSTRHRRGRATSWRSALGVLALVAFSAPPVAAAAFDSRGRAATPPPPLVNPVTLDIQGARIAPNVCNFSSTLELAPDQAAVREDVIAVDDATCTMRVQRGVPADLSEPATQGATSEKRGGAAPSGRGRPP